MYTTYFQPMFFLGASLNIKVDTKKNVNLREPIKKNCCTIGAFYSAASTLVALRFLSW